MKKSTYLFPSFGIMLCLLMFLPFVTRSAGSADQDTLRIGLDRFMSEEKFAPIADYLSIQLNMPVKYERFNSLIELTGNQSNYDMIYTNAFGYAYAQVTKLPFEAFLTRADKNQQPLTYTSCLITNSKSGILTAEQIIEKSTSSDLSFTYPSSTSGHIVPRIYLSQLLNQPLESRFQSITFESNHVDVIEKVGNGGTDIGACSCYWARKKIEENPKLKEFVSILWESPPIPYLVWAANNSLKKGLTDNIKKAFSTMLDIPEIRASVMRPDLTTYSAINNDAFSILIDQLKKDQELEFYLYYYEAVSE